MTDTPQTPPSSPIESSRNISLRKTIARLMAVQALYSNDLLMPKPTAPSTAEPNTNETSSLQDSSLSSIADALHNNNTSQDIASDNNLTPEQLQQLTHTMLGWYEEYIYLPEKAEATQNNTAFDLPKPDKIDRRFFRLRLTSTTKHLAEIDNILQRCLARGWPLHRINSIARAILRCATDEIQRDSSTVPPVIIAEYLLIAEAFLDDKDIAFVNAVLDKVSRLIRAQDSGESLRAHMQATLETQSTAPETSSSLDVKYRPEKLTLTLEAKQKLAERLANKDSVETASDRNKSTNDDETEDDAIPQQENISTEEFLRQQEALEEERIRTEGIPTSIVQTKQPAIGTTSIAKSTSDKGRTR